MAETAEAMAGAMAEAMAVEVTAEAMAVEVTAEAMVEAMGVGGKGDVTEGVQRAEGARGSSPVPS